MTSKFVTKEIISEILDAPFKHDTAKATIHWSAEFELRCSGIKNIIITVEKIMIETSFENKWRGKYHKEYGLHELDLNDWTGTNTVNAGFNWRLWPNFIHIDFKNKTFELNF